MLELSVCLGRSSKSGSECVLLEQLGLSKNELRIGTLFL